MSAVQPDAEDTPDSNQIMPEADAEEWRKRAEELFKSLPPPSIKPLPKGQTPDISKFKNQLGCTPAEAWQKCAAAIENYDAVSCKAHREEIDTLLVFAGLFSAVVTAFTVESYQWLQRDPNDTIIALLSQIAHPGSLAPTIQEPAGLPGTVAARINAYWFLSLTLSLASALLAILCKQWVREFERRGDQSPNVYISVRQTKLEGFEGWGVGLVVSTVPLLLQSALGLFALGLTELLWQLHRTVAFVVLIPTIATLLVYAATTLLPGLQSIYTSFPMLSKVSQCPFKSPQALLALRLQALLWKAFRPRSHDRLPTGSWITLDRHFTWSMDERCKDGVGRYSARSSYRGLAWLLNQTDHPDRSQWIWLCIWDIAVAPDDFDRDSHLLHGISHLMDLPSAALGDPKEPPSPCVLAFRFARREKINPPFFGELFVHLFPSLPTRTAENGWLYITDTLGNDDDTWRSGLHAVLDRTLSTAPRAIGSLRDLLTTAFCAFERPGSLSHWHELACIIALHLRELCSTCSSDGEHEQLLILCTLRYLSATAQSLKDQPAGVRSPFSAWILEIDRNWNVWLPPSRCFVLGTSDEGCESAYLDLLSDHADVITGGISGAKGRLARYMRHPELIFTGAGVMTDSHPPGDDLGVAPHALSAEQAGPSFPPVEHEGAPQSTSNPRADIAAIMA